MKSHHGIQEKTYSNLHLKKNFNSKEKDFTLKQNSGILKRNPKKFLDMSDNNNNINYNNIQTFSVRNFHKDLNNNNNIINYPEKGVSNKKLISPDSQEQIKKINENSKENAQMPLENPQSKFNYTSYNSISNYYYYYYYFLIFPF